MWDVAFGAVVTAFCLGVYVKEEFVDSVDSRGMSADEAREAYANGDLTESELETALEHALDQEHQAIVEMIRRVPGLDVELAIAVATEFDTREEVLRADADRLQKVHGIGPSRASAIQNFYTESNPVLDHQLQDETGVE